jgi:hypothetical protein
MPNKLQPARSHEVPATQLLLLLSSFGALVIPTMAEGGLHHTGQAPNQALMSADQGVGLPNQATLSQVLPRPPTQAQGATEAAAKWGGSVDADLNENRIPGEQVGIYQL